LKGVRIIPFDMIADRVLALIIEHPGISMPELKAALRDVNRNSVGNAIGMLREQGFIVHSPRHIPRGQRCNAGT
jgi:hypothetical protein